MVTAASPIVGKAREPSAGLSPDRKPIPVARTGIALVRACSREVGSGYRSRVTSNFLHSALERAPRWERNLGFISP